MTRRDYSTALILAALLVAVVRYAGAFIASDIGQIDGWVSDALAVAMGITGLGMGVLDVLGSAYVFDGWRKAMPRAGNKPSNRFLVLTGFVAALLVVGLTILIPYTVSRVTHQGVADVMAGGFVWGWAGAVNVAPYLIIGGVVTAQSGVVGIAYDKPQKPADVSQPVADIPQAAYPCGWGCGREFASLQSRAAHMKACAARNGHEPEHVKMEAQK